jgi:hypothetical protein
VQADRFRARRIRRSAGRRALRRLWTAVARQDDAPDATDEERGWGEILASAALQGAIFAVVKAAFGRGGAQGVRRVTGCWPA